MAELENRAAAVPGYRLRLAVVWLMMALSSVVMTEPAPYDLLAILLLALTVASGARFPQQLAVPAILLGLFLLANLISATAADNPVATLFPLGIRVYLAIMLLLFAGLIWEDPQRTLRVIWQGWIVAGIVAAVLGIGGYFRLLPGHDILTEFGRAKGAFKDPNVFGPFLVPVAIYTLARLEAARGLELLWRFATFLLVMFGIFFSFSRGAWANLVLSFLVYVAVAVVTFRSGRQYLRLLLFGGGVVAIGMVGLLYIVTASDIGAFFAERARLQSYDLGSGGRFTTQMAAIQRSLVNPIGVGPGQSFSELGLQPHNLYLHVLVENGWLGALAFWSLILLSLWRGFQFALRRSPVQRVYVVIFASACGVAAESLVIDSTHWRHLYLLLAMLWGPILAYPPRRA